MHICARIYAQQRHCANLFSLQRAWTAQLSLYMVRGKIKDEIETEVDRHVKNEQKERN